MTRLCSIEDASSPTESARPAAHPASCHGRRRVLPSSKTRLSPPSQPVPVTHDPSWGAPLPFFRSSKTRLPMPSPSVPVTHHASCLRRCRAMALPKTGLLSTQDASSLYPRRVIRSRMTLDRRPLHVFGLSRPASSHHPCAHCTGPTGAWGAPKTRHCPRSPPHGRAPST